MEEVDAKVLIVGLDDLSCKTVPFEDIDYSDLKELKSFYRSDICIFRCGKSFKYLKNKFVGL